MPQRIGAIFLSICLFITVAGYHLIYHIYLQQVKIEMKQYLLHIPSKEVIKLTVAVNDPQLQWEEETEFSLNGTMYDMLDKKVSGDSIIIRCVLDEKETALISEYQRINQQNNPSSQRKWASLYKQIDSFLAPALVAYPDYFLPVITVVFAYYQMHILSPAYPILSPPPQLS